MINQPFQSNLVLEETICEATLRAYNVGFDQNRFRLQPLVDVIAEVIGEFALGPHCGTMIPVSQLRRRLKEAAQRVYTTDKYKSRGEFGELILHLLLRDFCGTIPLISKIWFKDTSNVPVHGFDGVHILVTDEKKQMWLGESKLYADGKAGVKELASDLCNHLEQDYLRREFNLISTKLEAATPEIEYWRQLLHEHQKLEKVLDAICIPMVCTYTSPLFTKHKDNSAEFLTDFIDEIRDLKKNFDNKVIRTDVNALLLLLPIECKDKLTHQLNERLKHMQAI